MKAKTQEKTVERPTRIPWPADDKFDPDVLKFMFGKKAIGEFVAELDRSILARLANDEISLETPTEENTQEGE